MALTVITMRPVAASPEDKARFVADLSARLPFRVRVSVNKQRYAYGSVNVRPVCKPGEPLPRWTLGEVEEVRAALLDMGCVYSGDSRALREFHATCWTDGFNYLMYLA